MRPFARQPEPAFWGFYERRWLYETRGQSVEPLAWERDKQTLAKWFHASVRPEREPRHCAYCDGPLELESPETVDHFVPAHACRALALTWTNLFPACTTCNSKFKGTRWSCALVRPDVDPVEQWFDLDAETGKLGPASELDRKTRARVRLTLRVLGLNATERCTARKTLFRTLQKLWQGARYDDVERAITRGPYRIVAVKFSASTKRYGFLG